MKSNILVVCGVFIAIGLTAFGYVNRSNNVVEQVETAPHTTIFVNNLENSIEELADPDFFYDVDSRYIRNITKEDMDKVRSMADFLPKEQFESIVSFHSVSVSILDDNYEAVISETGESYIFNDAQVKLLRTAPYSADILIRAGYIEKNKEIGELEDSYTTPHITIIPEKEALYIKGKDALIEYLKESSKDQTVIVQKDKLQPGKVNFTVNKKGTISNVKLTATSGYPSIDKTMIELITKTPGNWMPAANAQGEKVDQKLVFSFGIVGC